jgi:hypothetical protein
VIAVAPSLVTDDNHLDGLQDCAPIHWNENFVVYFMTDKIRSQKDPYFSNLCDRVELGLIEDEIYLNTWVQLTESEKCNENSKNGCLSIIVKTNNNSQ